ncbi:hypothetical protein SAMN05216564_1107 [Halopenitus persicus]|uniref:Uncharacterized protein n=1 Tax=Halopenitus persicus TaxID=1048396 RepID=A0A1H3MN25_9EURY|nr:hypothetical protein SAMN05216564_1107 [Halopenitus persicus]
MTSLETLPEVCCPECDRSLEAGDHKGRSALVCQRCSRLGVVLFEAA